ncbi:hypothetical protein HW555_013294, partial [Spodoptera exigua]
ILTLPTATIRLFKTSSLCDLTADNSALFDTTMASLPNTSLNTSQTVVDLQERVKKLSEELDSAHVEIENLNSENFRLKTDIQKYLKTIDTYKELASNIDRKNNTPLSGRKRKTHQGYKISLTKPLIEDLNIKQTYSDKTQDLPVSTYHDKSPRASTQWLSNGSQYNRQENNCCNAENKILMLNKETQTTHQTYDNTLTHNNKRTLISNVCDVATKKSSGVVPKQKNKLAIISSGCTKGTLPLIEKRKHLSTIEHKLKAFSINDYCLIFIGENDLKNDDYMEILDNLRKYLKKNTHTNLVVCTPTFICGALIYNYKVELFNNLLLWEIKNNRYAYNFDTNRTLSLEMFSISTGKINKQGWKNILERIRSNIMYDYEVFSTQDSLTNPHGGSDDQLLTTNNTVTSEDLNELSATQLT